MAKKIIKTQYGSAQNTEDKDTRYLKFITRKLLNSVEEAANLYINSDSANMKAREENHNLLFGSKASLASTLVTLADLMIKLNQLAPSEKSRTSEEKSSQVLSDHDIALVEAFVKKIKSNPENEK